MIPRFTAERALQPAQRVYRTTGTWGDPRGAVHAQAATSGVAAGVVCIGNPGTGQGVLTVVLVDIDENGQTSAHNVDEIGSCTNPVPLKSVGLR
jgi:hypothetical protein